MRTNSTERPEAPGGPCQLPGQDDWTELCHTLKLDDRQSAVLGSTLQRIVGDIARHHTFTSELQAEGSRQQALDQLKRVSREFAKLSRILEDADRWSERLLRKAYGDRLGELISNAGIAAALGRPFHHGLGMHDTHRFESDDEDGWDPLAEVRWHPSPPGFHEMESYEAQAHGGPWDFFERHCEEQRRQLAREQGPRLLAGLIRELARPVRSLLELERRNRGGSPGKLYRNYTVQELIPAYQRMFAERPTSTPGGRFVLLCELVLNGIGLETDGVEQAVQRALRHMNKAC